MSRLTDHPAAAFLDQALPEDVREALVVAIVRSSFTQKRGGGRAAARALGMSEATMYRHLGRHRQWSRKTFLRVRTLISAPEEPSGVDETPESAVQ